MAESKFLLPIAPAAPVAVLPYQITIENSIAEQQQRTALRNVIHPHPHDVVCGRGGLANSHVGNETFLKIVAEHQPKYLTLSKQDKTDMSRRIVDQIRSLDPPGRFLKKDPKTNLWNDVGDQLARKKTSQALRERKKNISTTDQCVGGDIAPEVSKAERSKEDAEASAPKPSICESPVVAGPGAKLLKKEGTTDSEKVSNQSITPPPAQPCPASAEAVAGLDEVYKKPETATSTGAEDSVAIETYSDGQKLAAKVFDKKASAFVEPAKTPVCRVETIVKSASSEEPEKFAARAENPCAVLEENVLPALSRGSGAGSGAGAGANAAGVRADAGAGASSGAAAIVNANSDAHTDARESLPTEPAIDTTAKPTATATSAATVTASAAPDAAATPENSDDNNNNMSHGTEPTKFTTVEDMSIFGMTDSFSLASMETSSRPYSPSLKSFEPSVMDTSTVRSMKSMEPQSCGSLSLPTKEVINIILNDGNHSTNDDKYNDNNNNNNHNADNYDHYWLHSPVRKDDTSSIEPISISFMPSGGDSISCGSLSLPLSNIFASAAGGGGGASVLPDNMSCESQCQSLPFKDSIHIDSMDEADAASLISFDMSCGSSAISSLWDDNDMNHTNNINNNNMIASNDGGNHNINDHHKKQTNSPRQVYTKQHKEGGEIMYKRAVGQRVRGMRKRQSKTSLAFARFVHDRLQEMQAKETRVQTIEMLETMLSNLKKKNVGHHHHHHGSSVKERTTLKKVDEMESQEEEEEDEEEDIEDDSIHNIHNLKEEDMGMLKYINSGHSDGSAEDYNTSNNGGQNHPSLQDVIAELRDVYIHSDGNSGRKSPGGVVTKMKTVSENHSEEDLASWIEQYNK